jgi:antitoxin component of MazEF toxin-antitoxin module
MIEGNYKVIKIGSSRGVTIPAKDLKNQGITVGDEIKLRWEPVKKKSHNQHDKLMKEYSQFVSEYGQALKNLADR